MNVDALSSALFDAYPDGVLLVDHEGRIVLANHAASALLGWRIDELVGLDIESLVPEAARARHVNDRRAFQAAPRKRPMGLQMDLAARRRDGSEVRVEIALSPFEADGRALVMASVRDVGEYPRVKQALRRARHAECIARMGRLAVDNPDAQALLRGVPAAAAQALDAQAAALHVIDPDGRQLRSTGDASPVAPTVEAIAAAGPFAGASAWPGFASTLAVPVDDRGRTVGLIEVHTREPRAFDADDRGCLESLSNLIATALQRAAGEAALRHAQRLEAVGQLTGGIAHDFNNLLTIVQGNLQVLEDWPTVAADESARDLVVAAQRATRRGAELTAKLLAFSRRQMLQPRPIELQRFLPPLADLLRRTLDARIRIEVSIAPGTPRCQADPGQLEAALVNIAINARDAMPDGGTLAFAAAPCSDPPADVSPEAWRRGGVALSVRDTGTGMSEAVLARAFEPFFTTKEAGRGTGLGLATVHGFAHQSRGAVALASRPGAGTTVTLYLPAPDEPIAGASAPPSRGPASVPAGLRVLLVEDEPEVLRVVRAFLDGWGCVVTGASHAKAALAALERERFDLLLSDVVLGPGLRGTELAQRAQAINAAMPVLLMTGYAGESDAATGAFTVLRKPFTRERLAQAVAQAVSAAASGRGH